MSGTWKIKTYTIEQNAKGKYSCTCPAFGYGHGKHCKHIKEVLETGDKYRVASTEVETNEKPTNETFVKLFAFINRAIPDEWEVFQNTKAPVNAGLRDPKKPNQHYVHISTFDITPFVGYRVEFHNFPASLYPLLERFESELGLTCSLPAGSSQLSMVALAPVVKSDKNGYSATFVLRNSSENGAAWHMSGVAEQERQMLSFIGAKLDTLRRGLVECNHSLVEESIDGILADIDHMKKRFEKLRGELRVE